MKKRNNIIKPELTDLEIDIGYKLIDLLKEKEYVSYEELASYFGIRPDHISHQLGNIDMVCYRLEIPLISANVVNKGTNQPNIEGFFKVLNECNIPVTQFESIVKEARECKNWDRLSEELRKIYNISHNKNMQV